MADPVSLGITVALTAANMALTASRKIEGPRLDDLGYTGGDYGAPRPRAWGMRRLQAPVIHAEELTEVKRRRKTKGGKYNEYTYYGTWMVLLAAHEISAARRIWFDGNLVYDLSGAGPVTPFDFGSSPGAISLDDHIRIYLGTSDQEVDPRYDAWCTNRYGEGSATAFRDTAYIMFEGIPLEKLGNRIPQVTVEIVTSATGAWPTEEVAVSEGGGDSGFFSPDFSAFYTGNYYGMTVLDTAARAVIAEIDGTFEGLENRHVAWEEGAWLASRGGDDHYYVYSVFGGATFLSSSGSYRWLTSAQDASGTWHWGSYSLGGTIYVDGVAKSWSGNYPAIFADIDGNIWHLNRETSTSSTFRQLVAGEVVKSFTVTGLASGNPSGGAFHYRDDTTDRFIFDFGGTIYAISTEDGTIEDTYSSAHGTPSYRNIAPGAKTFWAGFYEINSADLTLVRSFTPSTTWGVSKSATSRTIYDPINHALIVSGATGPLWLYLDRIAPEAVTLGAIAASIAAIAAISADEIDTSDLTQEIDGYSVGGGSGKDWLEPLLDIHDSDARPHGFDLQFLRRGGASSGSIDSSSFAQPRDDSSLYERPATGGSDLPALVSLKFADVDADQQPNLAYSGPLGEIDSVRTVKLDMSNWAVDTDTAHQVTARWHRRRHFEAGPYGLSLPMQQVGLEPVDVMTLALPDGRTIDARLTSMVCAADRTITTEWRRDDVSLASLDGATGAPFDGRNESTLPVPLLSRGYVLDIPLLSDGDAASTPGVYVLAGPVADGTWPGATTYQEIDGEYSEELASTPSSDAVTWGTVSSAMPYANPNLWDRGTTLTVTIRNGELTGCTEAAANANPRLNQAVIGDNGRWEVVQFTNAVLVSPGVYAVSGFKRGRRGTEWAAELHAAGDGFVLVDDALAVAMGLSEVGTEVSFKPITAGRTTGFAFGYTFEGQSLKPYAPAHLEAVKDSSGDWTFTWVRRTRLGGAWTSGSTIPLGEVSEEYELTLGDGVTTVAKSPTTASYVWDVATQTTDTGAEVMETDLEWSVAQVSDAVGAGFAATA